MIALLLLATTIATGPSRPAHAEPKPQRPSTAMAPERAAARARLASVGSWGYQLRLIDPAEVAASPFDLVVVDHAISANRRFVRAFTPEEVATMKRRPDGSSRLVLAYLSIGEAERYRFYWDQAWYEPATRPVWLGEVNPRWDGNFPVHFWHADWRRILLGRPGGYIDRIQAQGFDGIYLDRADVYAELEGQNPRARRDMLALLADIAREARGAMPGFLVVMQNAEELLADARLRAALDGAAKEDLFYGTDHRQGPNPPAMIDGSLVELRRARRAGLKVLAVEYLDDPARAADAERRARREGFTYLRAERSLGSLALDPARP